MRRTKPDEQVSTSIMEFDKHFSTNKLIETWKINRSFPLSKAKPKLELIFAFSAK